MPLNLPWNAAELMTANRTSRKYKLGAQRGKQGRVVVLGGKKAGRPYRKNDTFEQGGVHLSGEN